IIIDTKMSGCERTSILSCIAELDECSSDNCRDEAAPLASPISSIVCDFMNSTLSPRSHSNRKNDVTDKNV
ncbi:unnamed protein product, partial [Heterotrigona itama]